jgi:peptide-methionine (S)-S-oxide reductase
MNKAMFGAGCFWGIEEAFSKVDGVLETAVGYSGGDTIDPKYKEVCNGQTNHTEVVELSFDPNLVSYSQLLDLFWNLHNPTTLNRQGLDFGSQYRSAIYYYSPEQQTEAQDLKEKLEASGKFKDPVVTEITEVALFYRAEEYHQRYFEKNGAGACKL